MDQFILMFHLSSAFGRTINLICGIGMLVVITGFLLKKINQPNLVSYILIGVLIGSHGLDFIEQEETMRFIGELGIVLLFFFIGMEIDLSSFVRDWKIAVFGTLAQIILSIALVSFLGFFIGWNNARCIVLGCVIALSSSAVIFKLLEDKNLMKSRIGQNVTSILLAQDMAIVPILIITSLIGGEHATVGSIILKIIGGCLIFAIITLVYIKKEIHWLPFKKSFAKDHELQVFLALFFCFAGALVASLFGLSEALGAFVGGLIMHAGKATKWIFDAIHSFRILFVAIFFISVGAQIDLLFLRDNAMEIGILLISVFVVNHMINATILRISGNPWSLSLVGGALLSQIGELSFLICVAAFNYGILTQYSYDFTISLISLTICISPLWIIITEKIVGARSSSLVS
jgi:CPA2 family monovalent cation:H+ antiporter-2